MKVKTWFSLPFLLCSIVLWSSGCKKDVAPVAPNDTPDSMDSVSITDSLKPCDTCLSPFGTPGIDEPTSHKFIWRKLPQTFYNTSAAIIFGYKNAGVFGEQYYKFNGDTLKALIIKDQDNRSFSQLDVLQMIGSDSNDFWIIGKYILFRVTDRRKDTLKCTRYFVSTLNVPLKSELLAAWGLNTDNIYFVGRKGTIIHYDHDEWSNISIGTTDDINSIWGSSDHNLWVTTGPSPGALWHYDGTSWSKVTLPTPSTTLCRVWGCDSAGQSIIYVGGTHIYRKKGSADWIVLDSLIEGYSGANVYMLNIVGTSPNNILIAGRNYMVHWNGRTWKRLKEVEEQNDAPYPIDLTMKNNEVLYTWKGNNGYFCGVGRQIR